MIIWRCVERIGFVSKRNSRNGEKGEKHGKGERAKEREGIGPLFQNETSISK
jgi:hypothetical protein